MQDSYLKFLLNVSRPRFWLYVLGPYLVGIAAGADTAEDLVRWDMLIFALYFLFPANLLIYGINDIFDFETDRRNPKKSEYELLVRPESHRPLLRWIAFLNIPFIIAAYFIAPQAIPSMGGFIFFSVFYSAPPIRAKAIPIIDSAFNILYVFPGAFAYQLITGNFPPLIVIAAASMWTMAMHAYSAIPDIEADREAGVSTIATLLGSSWTHTFCQLCYTGATILSITYIGPVALLGFLYLLIMRFSELSSKKHQFIYYKSFPWLNSLIGFALFWYIAWPKIF
ncbi:prenyltransferase [Leptolyngbya sp. 7M]|uniref:prenyltransferase n=1 Tax=Leptolyngbya sp. 7M TaxID=2812896 RepID=UPI001B8AC650|nr:prenyltransferase [Leptolyngbya sp. 7M]QYO66660.1 prenyltransferase [Leptolyngbya sp. 7M]